MSHTALRFENSRWAAFGPHLYLLSHGVVKLFLIAGLLRNRLWAYPVSLVVMGLFIAYRLYCHAQNGGAGLIVLTLFDLFVIAS